MTENNILPNCPQCDPVNEPSDDWAKNQAAYMITASWPVGDEFVEWRINAMERIEKALTEAYERGQRSKTCIHDAMSGLFPTGKYYHEDSVHRLVKAAQRFVPPDETIQWEQREIELRDALKAFEEKK